MRSKILRTWLIIVSLLIALPAAAATKEEKRVADAADVLDQLLRMVVSPVFRLT